MLFTMDAGVGEQEQSLNIKTNESKLIKPLYWKSKLQLQIKLIKSYLK